MERNKLLEIHDIVEKMRGNSAEWHDADAGKRIALEKENQELGKSLRKNYGLNVIYSGASGVWYLVGSERLYDIY